MTTSHPDYMPFAWRLYASYPADDTTVMAGVPLTWPAESRKIQDEADRARLEADPNWIVGTWGDYIEHVARVEPDYNVWYAAEQARQAASQDEQPSE